MAWACPYNRPPDSRETSYPTERDLGRVRMTLVDLETPPAEPRRGLARHLGTLIRDTLEAVGLAVVLFLVLQLFVQNTVVEGSSMVPNFVDQEHLLVNKLAYRVGEPKRGDVVVFHAPGVARKDFIKRVIALPGETVELNDGVVLVNGGTIDEPWAPRFDDSDYGPYTVPQESYFVLGDNRGNSNDSRVFGNMAAGDEAQPAIPRDRIVGRVWLSVWPMERWGVVRADSPDAGAETEGLAP
jgi:signal peptidase I